MTIHHLLDHNGTINSMVSPLSWFSGHRIHTSFQGQNCSNLENLQSTSSRSDAVVLHSTGNDYKFFNAFNFVAGSFDSSFVFMHVSPEFLKIKGRNTVLDNLRYLNQAFGTVMLATGDQVVNAYQRQGIPAKPVQAGIELAVKPLSGVSRKPKFVVTTCTSKSDKYQTIKGIDLFVELVNLQGCASSAVIAGFDGPDINGIRCQKFSREELNRLMADAAAYIQLSRTETYNLTAVEAKRLGVPIIVSDIEGHIDNVRHGFRVQNFSDALPVLSEILRNPRSSVITNSIEANYCDSVSRETLAQFHLSLVKATQSSRSSSIQNLAIG